MITGPIANDTIYDIWGITTSGLLKPAEALHFLSVGPEYTQTVLKTQKAASHLHFIKAYILPENEISSCQEAVRQEEKAYQIGISEYIQGITE